MTLKGVLKPEYLPPTEGDVIQHTLRAYLQYHDWLTLESMSLDPLECGWQRTEDGDFQPIGTVCDITPQQLLKLTVCNCKIASNCASTKCSCKSLGVKSISACGNCNGLECANAS